MKLLHSQVGSLRILPDLGVTIHPIPRRQELPPAVLAATSDQGERNVNYYGTAEAAAAAIVKAFENPSTLPAPLATLFIKTGLDLPCDKWSWRNRLLVVLSGHTDARGFRQWQQVGRWVRKGEKAFTILAPVLKTVQDHETKKEKEILVGFRGIPVFGLGQTDGQPLPSADPDSARWVESLPLMEVARNWGLSVEVFDGYSSLARGHYRWGKEIGLGVKNLATWCHELVHAADDRLGNLIERGQHWRSETVAQLGAAVLLRLLGYEEEADLGFACRYISGYVEAEGLELIGACCQVQERVCQAVRFILDTAEEIAESSTGQDDEKAEVQC